MSFTTFGTWGRGMKVTRYSTVILLTYLRSVLHVIFNKQYSDYICFLQFLAENYKSYLIYVKYTCAPYLLLVRMKIN